MTSFLKKIPGVRFLSELPFLSKPYHYILAFIGALVYGFPSRKMVIIGVTGTKGKTTTANLIAHVLQSAGYKTAMATTVNFRLGDEEWRNETKQTMLGRFSLQKFLKRAADLGCEYAVVETSSEGILQYRHRFIDYDIAVFTNLSPEHIERHGSFEDYREAKLRLFKQVSQKRDGMGVYNLDDEHVKYFLAPPMSAQYGYGMKESQHDPERQVIRELLISDVELTPHGTKFKAGGEEYHMPILGMLNVYNAGAAICVAASRLIPAEKIRAALKTARPVPGRLELVDVGQPYKVMVDYAHEPASLEAVYESAKIFHPKRVISILGSQGGGRDKWKRSAMGRVAASRADILILTDEDPYDENPEDIIRDIEKGTEEVEEKKRAEILKIVNREEAIKKAISLAGPGDVVLLTGKGGETSMCVSDGKRIPWSDREIAEEAIRQKGL